MVRDRFIDGQEECALRRHLDSLGPDTPMADIIDCRRVWESHIEVAIKQQSRTDRHPPRAVCQVTEDEQSPVESPETELLEDIIRKLLPTPSPPPLEGAPIPSDQDLLIQRLMGAICPSQPVAQVEIDRFGNHVAELASSRNSHGGGRRFAEFVIGFRRGVFFVRGFDKYPLLRMYMMPECIPTVTPKLAAAPQAASEVAETRPRGYCCMNLLPPVGESIESLDVGAPDAVASRKETAGGSSKVGSDICVVPDVLQTAVSVTTVVSEKWIERFVLNLDDLRSDVLASGEDPAGGSSDVGSDVCVVPDPRTAVSVRTVVTEK